MALNTTSQATQTGERIWLDAYPEDVPAEVDVEAFSSVVEVLERSVHRFRDLPAFANMGTSLTDGELDQKPRDFAAFL